ncbi:protocatechuate 4,5-dioxygenase, alpha chain [Erwinia amylovora MR1]|nr:protocatechuate 4,5-dioxygenase, alpha chain [Erwinia amylovora MR1]
MWLIMRGALSANVQKLHQDYYLPSMTGIVTLILETQSREATVDVHQRQRDKINL